MIVLFLDSLIYFWFFVFGFALQTHCNGFGLLALVLAIGFIDGLFFFELHLP